MSIDLLDESGVVITRYAGPDKPPMGGVPYDRRRYQVAVWSHDHQQREIVSFTQAQWEVLGEWFCRDCSVECEGPHLDLTWDKAVGT